jgi:signal transduction histidine kinase
MIGSRQSLSAMHAGIVALAAVCVMALVGAFDLLESVSDQRQRYAALREQTVDTIEDALAQAVWHFDRAATREILRGALTFDYIRQIEVVNPDGSVYAVATSGTSRDAHWLGEALFADLAQNARPLVLEVERRHGSELAQLGSVRVTLDLGYVGATFQDYVLQTVIEQATVVIALAVLVTIFVRRALTRPLNRLAEQVTDLHAGEIEAGHLDVPAMHRDNEIGKVIASFNDLLDRVQDSQRLREEVIRKEYSRQFLSQVKERLEHEIAERTQELREEKRHAEMASRAKSIFLANMSHELRTPLNGVIGYAEMMKEEVMGPISPPIYKSYVDNIHGSGKHMLALIEEVLSLSETEFGTIQLDERVLDAGEAIRGAVDTLHPLAANRQIGLAAEPPSTPISISADPGKLRQMLLNLISNAIKYTDAGGAVSVSAHREPAGEVVVAVTDTGRGIESHLIDDVLEPFNRGSSPMLNEGGGLGLGLPLTKRIMEAHDGTLELRSEFGRGTTALLRFPAARVQHDAA